MSPPAYNFFLSSLKKARSGLLGILAISFFVNLLMLATPLYMLQVYDRVLTSQSTDTLLLLTLIVMGALVVIGLLEIVRSSTMGRISRWLSQYLSGEALITSIRHCLKRSQTPNVQPQRDLDTLRNFLTTPAIYPMVDAPWATIYLAAIFFLHPTLGWIALLGAIVLLAIAVANDLATRGSQKAAAEMNISALKQAEAAVRNADVVEAMGMAPHLVDKWHLANMEALDLQATASKRSNALTASSRFVRMSLQVAILGTGAYLTILGEMTAGAIIASSILVGRALAPVDQAISTWRSALSAKAAHDRLEQHFSSDMLEHDFMPLPTPEGQVSVEGVSYLYPGASEPVLRNATFTLGAGESMAIVGPSGSGKTTLGRIILGNLSPVAGHARLDGMDVAEWHPDDRGKHIGYLPQDVELFAGSVRENIARMADGDSEDIISAARLADVHEMVMRLPKGYDSQVGPDGMALSGGQRQRIALARALYGNPRLIVLDEPNSSLDHAGDAALAHALSNLKEHRLTTIVISHRTSILEHVDKILVLQDGEVRAFGPSKEVLAQMGRGQQQPQGRQTQQGLSANITYQTGRSDG